MTSINMSHEVAARLTADAIIVAIAKGEDGPQLLTGAESVDEALGGNLAKTLSTLGATGKADEITKVPGGGNLKADVVVAVGVGDAKSEYQPEAYRRAVGAAIRALTGKNSAAIALPATTPNEVGAVAEGALLGAYAFQQYKSDNGNNKKAPVAAVTLVSPVSRDEAAKKAVTRAEVVASAVNLVRDWVNTPPSDLHPKEFAEAVVAAADGLPLDIEVLDEAALKDGGYGGILGVGQGSLNPPRLVRLAYRNSGATKHVALVGKGITFDSGGLSLKPADSMVTMKSDMAGAAAVLATGIAIAKLAPKVNVTVYAPMAENMPSGAAQRPSDVLTIYGGKTVEVLNTDAEGRLVLADALVRASDEKPDLLVDVATLTGACIVALGTRVAGIMSNDDKTRDLVHSTAEGTGELTWPLPMPEELREKLDSPIADIANIGDRWGGALSAAVFLKEFVPDDVKWAHIDIAGPSFNEGAPYGYTPKGATGTAVRTLVRLIEAAES